MSYYREIDGKSYDASLLETAEKLTSGRGDGRLAREDAETLIAQLKDGGSYTDIEKDTIAYIRENFAWTDAADDWFRTEVRKWAARSND